MAIIKNFHWTPDKHPGLARETWIVDNSELVRSALLKLKGRFIGLDLETVGVDPQIRPNRIRLLILSDGQTVVIFDLFSLGQKSKDTIRDWVISPERVKIIHNAKFDMKFLCFELGWPELYPLFDTQLCAQLLDLGDEYGKHDYGYCVQHFLNRHVDKDIRHGWSGTLTERQYIYASNDGAHLPDLRVEMLRQAKERGLLRACKLEFDACYPTARMELNGFGLDPAKWRRVTEASRKRLFEVQDKLLELLPPVNGDTPGLFEGVPHFNLSSKDELKDRLKAVGITLPKSIKKDAEGVEVETETLLSEKMEQIAGQHEVIPFVIEYGKLSTAVNSYGKNFLKWINPHDHRLHANFRQIGTPTTRYAAKEPPLHGIPKKSAHRECFVSEPGWKLVWADYSQIELRILAELSQDPKLIQVFVDGKDLHEFTAREVFEIVDAAVSEAQRRLGKDLNFGEVYGVGVKRFALKARIGVDRAKVLLEKQQQAFPVKTSYLRNAGNNARVRGYCHTMSGKQITFVFDRKDNAQCAAIERYGKNYPIQGSSADITKRAMRLVQDRIEPENAKLVNCVHDELVLEVRDEHVEPHKQILWRAMMDAGEEFLKVVPVVVDVETNDYWKKKEQ